MAIENRLDKIRDTADQIQEKIPYRDVHGDIIPGE